MQQADKRPVALITGASSGIGAGFAQELAKRGHDLVLVARRSDLLDELAATLTTDYGARAEVLAADLTTTDGVAAAEARIRAGDIDMLVNNAGFGTSGEFATLLLARELEEVDLNVRALVRLTYAALQPMYQRGSGAIINVASTGAFQPVPYMATYGATKAFVLHFSEAVHEEARRHGVSVTCLCPGPVRTGFQQAADVGLDRVPSFALKTVEQVVRAALSASRRGRAIAIPGVVNRATAESVRITPRFLVRKIAGSIFRDTSAVPASAPAEER